jgi:hypothetical protein
MLVSRLMQLTKNDVVDDGEITYLNVDGHRLALPPRLARLTRQLRDQGEQRWTLARLGTPAPWLFPGQSPARPTVDILFGIRLQRHGIKAHAGRNTARLALAAELPASVLADLTGVSIATAERWSQWAKRDWTAYIAQRMADQASVPSTSPSMNGLYRHDSRGAGHALKMPSDASPRRWTTTKGHSHARPDPSPPRHSLSREHRNAWTWRRPQRPA